MSRGCNWKFVKGILSVFEELAWETKLHSADSRFLSFSLGTSGTASSSPSRSRRTLIDEVSDLFLVVVENVREILLLRFDVIE